MLRYDGMNDISSSDFWLFYLSDRLNQVGNAPENNMKYSVPKGNKTLVWKSFYYYSSFASD